MHESESPKLIMHCQAIKRFIHESAYGCARHNDRPLTTSVYTIKVIIEINVELVNIYDNKNCVIHTGERERVSKTFNNLK